MPYGLARLILIATFVAGSLDILAAAALTLASGREPAGMLRFVASGPFPEATQWGAGGALLGLLVHFAIMAAMVCVYVAAAARLPRLAGRPIAWGTAYGLATYVVMNLIVVPLRFPSAFPPGARSIVTQLFCHIVLVGIPIALIAARHFGRRAFR